MMKYVFKILLVLYLIVGMVPNLEAIDKVVTQWLYLNILNTISLIFILFKGHEIKKYFFDKSSILFFCLFFWSVLSIIFATNRIESLVVLSQILAIVVAFIIIKIFLSEINNPFALISNIISVYLIVELALIYSPFTKGVDLETIFSRSFRFIGFAANVNITAFSLLYKIPFFVYSILKLEKLNKVLIFLISVFIYFLIFFVAGTLNSTRGAILTYTTFAPVFFIISIIVYFKSKQKALLINSVTYIVALVLSFQFNSMLSNKFDKGESIISDRMSSLTALVDNQQKKDGSLIQRINFYSHAVNSIFKNPFLGVGLGNWKIKSIDLNKENIIVSSIPYHVHNDYLEIGAEIGIVGLGIYIAILFSGFKKVFFNGFEIIFKKKKLKENYLIWITIFLFFYVYLIDSNINFPFHRPIVLINLIVLLAYLNTKKMITSNGK